MQIKFLNAFWANSLGLTKLESSTNSEIQIQSYKNRKMLQSSRVGIYDS